MSQGDVGAGCVVSKVCTGLLWKGTEAGLENSYGSVGRGQRCRKTSGGAHSVSKVCMNLLWEETWSGGLVGEAVSTGDCQGWAYC